MDEIKKFFQVNKAMFKRHGILLGLVALLFLEGLAIPAIWSSSKIPFIFIVLLTILDIYLSAWTTWFVCQFIERLNEDDQ